MIALTHAVFAWFLSVLSGLNPVITILASLALDAEYILNTVHRGPLHSLVFVVPACALALFYNREAGEGISVGVFSHLFLDSFTVMGLPLFYPFINEYFSLHFYNSTVLEWLVIVISSVLVFNSEKVFRKQLPKKVLAVVLLVWLGFLVMFKLFSYF